MQTLYAISRMVLLIGLYLLAGTAAADRLNQTIATLEKGEAAFGIFSGDRSMSNARSLARAPIDFVLIDMEHGPYDAESLQRFLLGMTDKSAIASSGTSWISSFVFPSCTMLPLRRVVSRLLL